MNKEEIPRFCMGSKEKPVTNGIDLLNTMRGRKNTIIYAKGNFELNEHILFDIHIRNIELINIEEEKYDTKCK